jgi:hypothetical protein
MWGEGPRGAAGACCRSTRPGDQAAPDPGLQFALCSGPVRQGENQVYRLGLRKFELEVVEVPPVVFSVTRGFPHAEKAPNRRSEALLALVPDQRLSQESDDGSLDPRAVALGLASGPFGDSRVHPDLGSRIGPVCIRALGHVYARGRDVSVSPPARREAPLARVASDLLGRTASR